MKDGVILRVSKPARMRIDDAPLDPLRSAFDDEVLLGRGRAGPVDLLK